MSEAFGLTIIMVASLTGMALVLLSFRLLVRYSFNDHHLRVKLFGMFCIRSIPYREMREVRVIPWWKAWVSLEFLWAEIWPSHIFSREYVLIQTITMCRYVFLSPPDPATFATTLSSRIGHHVV